MEDLGIDPDALSIAVRKPEKNQAALQQLTLADRERFEKCILADIDDNTKLLLHRLKIQNYIEGFGLEEGNEEGGTEAVVYLNGNLVKLTSYAKKMTQMQTKTGLSKLTGQLAK